VSALGYLRNWYFLKINTLTPTTERIFITLKSGQIKHINV
jgi:hypothetical protein